MNRARKYTKKKPAVTEREMSSYTFPSATPLDMSETDITSYRLKSRWDVEDDHVSVILDGILNPQSDTNNREKKLLSILV